MKKLKLVIAGAGFVGNAHHHHMKLDYDIDLYDPYKKGTKIVKHIDWNADGLIMCVSTPQADDGSCDFTALLDVLSKTNPDTKVLIKSTFSLDGLKQIRERFPHHSITFSPEFLRGAHAIEDLYKTYFMICGGDDADFWFHVFNKCWPTQQNYECGIEEAIVLKYAENSFFAVKVSFFNQLFDVCQEQGLDFESMRKGLCLDRRIGPDHSRVTELRGWGGHCLPKDTSAMLHQYGHDTLSVLNEACEYNRNLRDGNLRDHETWEDLKK